MLIYWLLFVLSVCALLGCLAASVTMGARFREDFQPIPYLEPLLSLSMNVPLKGADDLTAAHLDALVESELATPVEYLFAMESADDPAFQIGQAVKERHPEKEIRLVVSGPAEGRMGKQHNLAAASKQARYEAIGSMDADVLVEPETLARGLRYLAVAGTGVAYFLPCYDGPGPIGGLLVALYSNYYYQLYMGALALSIPHAPFITGALWLMSKTTLETIGGLEQFGLTVSDDAAIGEAVVRHHLRNVLVPRTVMIPFERLDLRGGSKHLLKWLTLLRAQGLPTYLSILLLWHPLLWSCLTVLVGVLLPGLRHPTLLASVLLLAVALVTRWSSAFLLNHRVYAFAGARFLSWLVVYELVAVPLLFTRGFFQSSIEWRGRRYQVGRHGVIKEVG